MWNLYDQTDFGEVVESFRAVELTKHNSSNKDKALAPQGGWNAGMVITVMMMLSMLIFVSGSVNTYIAMA